jgi:hypothetical protein
MKIVKFMILIFPQTVILFVFSKRPEKLNGEFFINIVFFCDKKRHKRDEMRCELCELCVEKYFKHFFNLHFSNNNINIHKMMYIKTFKMQNEVLLNSILCLTCWCHSWRRFSNTQQETSHLTKKMYIRKAITIV